MTAAAHVHMNTQYLTTPVMLCVELMAYAQLVCACTVSPTYLDSVTLAGPRVHVCFSSSRYPITGLLFMVGLLSLITAFSLEVHESCIFDCAVSDPLTLQRHCEEKYIKYWEEY